MTQEERNKLYIARCLIGGKMTISEGAEILKISGHIKIFLQMRIVVEKTGTPLGWPPFVTDIEKEYGLNFNLGKRGLICP